MRSLSVQRLRPRGGALVARDADAQRALAQRFDFPYLAEAGELRRELVCAYDPFTEQAEQLRNLRAQLELLHFGHGRRSLALVGQERGEGRSYITANLAVSFAQLQVPTVLVDANLRAPSQHRLFGLDPQADGLSWVLAGRAAPEQLIRPIAGLRNLHVLPAGIVPPSPSELLGRARLAALLEHLGRTYEVILVDTPAWRGRADTQLIAAQCHGALLVVRNDVTRVRPLRQISRALAAVNTALVGVAVNRAPRRAGKVK